MENPIYILYVQSVYTGFLQGVFLSFLLFCSWKKTKINISKVMLEKQDLPQRASQVSHSRGRSTSDGSVVQPENLWVIWRDAGDVPAVGGQHIQQCCAHRLFGQLLNFSFSLSFLAFILGITHYGTYCMTLVEDFRTYIKWCEEFEITNKKKASALFCSQNIWTKVLSSTG